MTALISLELFVASPGDVSRERQAVTRVAAEIVSTIGSVLEVNIHPFLWEDDLGPGADVGGPQALIDAHSNLVRCDVLVGVFSNRLGTPTKDGKTGTEHEFWSAYERWKRVGSPHIMLYFSEKPIAKEAASLEQGRLVTAFQAALPREVLPWRYKTPQHFEGLFRQHLTRHVMQVWNERGRPADRIRFSDSTLKFGLVNTAADVIQTNADIVTEAEEVFFATGSRGRDDKYFRAVEARLQEVPTLTHHRVLMGFPFKLQLKQHLLNLLKIRAPEDRSHGFKTLHIGLFEKPLQQAEVFIAGNEKRVLIVLPSRKGIGEYNSALIVDDPSHAKDLHNFVKQLYAASKAIEAVADIEALPILVGPSTGESSQATIEQS
jgi:hypothetical protein